MIGMGEHRRSIVRVRAVTRRRHSRDAPHHASWPERGVMPGSTMIGGHLAMAAGLALATQLERKGDVSLAFFGDGTLGSGVARPCISPEPGVCL
jgi:TPP-dependent pyruvate/acetoin dehydrogenase alpha subunit